MPYDVPGRADDLEQGLVDRWNRRVGEEYKSLFEQHGSRFITADPDSLPKAEPVAIQWFAVPAEPVTCLDRASARQLADWRAFGRHAVQDEYAEYAIELRPDGDGRMRPKRVQVTTELREYWLEIATADPDAVAGMAEDVLGRRPTWTELYGIEDPHSLDEPQRQAHFIEQVAGDGRVPPKGDLNTANALFMTHRINGLDDLIYIVMFGATPYAVRLPDGSRRRASRDEIFSLEEDLRILACRHADPVAALTAHDAAWDGRTVAFANPLGMYIKAFNEAALTVDGRAVPDEWIRWGRGEEGMPQRLVVGPPDDDERFLDDITVAVGAAAEPLVGGFQLLQQIEVGPLVVQGPQSAVEDAEFKELAELEESIDCAGSFACDPLIELKRLFDREQGTRRTGRRSVISPDG